MTETLPASADKEARLWAMATHLSAFAGYCLFAAGFVVGPLLVWAMKKSDLPAVDDQGKEALNFNMSILLYELIAVGSIIGIPIALLIIAFHILFTVIAAVKSYDGEVYRYPLTIRFIK